MKYKFNNDKYLTKRVQTEVPLELQLFIWRRIEDLSKSKLELDYLQIFEISKDKNMIKIIHKQEEPEAFKKTYHIFDELIVSLINNSLKIYVIDNIDHSIMLLANEY